MRRAALVAVAGAVLATALVRWGPGLAQLLLEELGVVAPVAAEALFTLLVFGAMLLLACVGGRLSGVRALAPGLRPLRSLAFGCVVGCAGLGIAVGYAALAGNVTLAASTARLMVLAAGCGTVALQVIAEEAYFRGWMQPVLARGWGAPAGVITSAAMFAGVHAVGGASGTVTLLNLFAGGMLFGVLAWRGGGIAAAVGAHLGWNVAEQLVLGLDPNPGLGSFGAVWNLELGGAPLWGGSDQGLNASVAMSFALAALLAPLLLRGRLFADVAPVAPAARAAVH